MDQITKIPKSMVLEGITPETIELANKIAKNLSEEIKDGDRRFNKPALTTSQLRKFYGEVKRIQAHGYNTADVVLLKPKLAYAVGRAEKDKGVRQSRIRELMEILSPLIDSVRDETSFRNFVKIFEAIVAYHKIYTNK